MHLMRTGAAGIIVGGGTNTNEFALGIEVPMATAIADVSAARREYLDETGGRYVHIIADGEIATSGDVATLAPAAEAAGKGSFWPAVAGHPRFPRGLVEAPQDFWLGGAEAPSLEKILRGPSAEAFGNQNIVGGLRRAMAKCGYTDLKSFQKVGLAVKR